MNYKDEDTFNRSFRKMLLELRKNMLCSQTDLSRYVGITRQSVSQMECGKRMPSLQRFCELAQGVGLTPAQLMDSLEHFCEVEFRRNASLEENATKALEYVAGAKQVADTDSTV